MSEGFDRLVAFRSRHVLIRFALADEIEFRQRRGELVFGVETFSPERDGFVQDQALFFRSEFRVMGGDEIQQETRTGGINIQRHPIGSTEVGDVSLIGPIGRDVRRRDKLILTEVRNESTQFKGVQGVIVESDQIHRAMMHVRRFEETEITKTNMDAFTR